MSAARAEHPVKVEIERKLTRNSPAASGSSNQATDLPRLDDEEKTGVHFKPPPDRLTGLVSTSHDLADGRTSGSCISRHHGSGACVNDACAEASVTMGTGIPTTLLLNLPYPSIVPSLRPLAAFFLFLDIILFAVFTVTIVIRYTRFPTIFRHTISHSVQVRVAVKGADLVVNVPGHDTDVDPDSDFRGGGINTRVWDGRRVAMGYELLVSS